MLYRSRDRSGAVDLNELFISSTPSALKVAIRHPLESYSDGMTGFVVLSCSGSGDNSGETRQAIEINRELVSTTTVPGESRFKLKSRGNIATRLASIVNLCRVTNDIELQFFSVTEPPLYAKQLSTHLISGWEFYPLAYILETLLST